MLQQSFVEYCTLFGVLAQILTLSRRSTVIYAFSCGDFISPAAPSALTQPYYASRMPRPPTGHGQTLPDSVCRQFYAPLLALLLR